MAQKSREPEQPVKDLPRKELEADRADQVKGGAARRGGRSGGTQSEDEISID